MVKYNILLCDPPWFYRDRATSGKRGVGFKYPLITDEKLKTLPVSSIAADDSCLFMWVTMPKLQEAFGVINAWGFEYKTCAFTWVKLNKKSESLFWGMGNWTRSNTELCLLATRGRPKRASASVHSVISSHIEGHSKKPDEVREKIVKLCGDLPRIELFARQQVSGWDCAGFDIDGKDIFETISNL
jgi:N6-adenosine-specific RNA methylase IME4